MVGTAKPGIGAPAQVSVSSLTVEQVTAFLAALNPKDDRQGLLGEAQSAITANEALVEQIKGLIVQHGEAQRSAVAAQAAADERARAAAAEASTRNAALAAREGAVERAEADLETAKRTHLSEKAAAEAVLVTREQAVAQRETKCTEREGACTAEERRQATARSELDAKARAVDGLISDLRRILQNLPQ